MTTVRALLPDDAEASWRLGRLAFGGPEQMPPDRPFPPPGARSVGAFDGDRLLGKAIGLEHEYRYGGRVVPALLDYF
ncbi:MAG: hypothetical protein ACT4QG_01190 [Sporichthyaceae bacterium]